MRDLEVNKLQHDELLVCVLLYTCEERHLYLIAPRIAILFKMSKVP